MISASFEEHQNHYLTRDITRRTETAGSMSFRLKWINKLDEDVYMYTIASLFGLIFCNATSSNVCHIRYQLDIEFSLYFFQYPDHSQSQIEDGYRKEISFLFSHLLSHCLYSCCGSLVFTVIC